MPVVSKRAVSAVQLVFDTNILVDALLARGHYYQDAVKLLEEVRNGKMEGWYAPHSVTTVYYLVERTPGSGNSQPQRDRFNSTGTGEEIHEHPQAAAASGR